VKNSAAQIQARFGVEVQVADGSSDDKKVPLW